jgi:hypothetical protein
MSWAAFALIAGSTAVKMGNEYRETKNAAKAADSAQDSTLQAASSAEAAGEVNARNVERQGREESRIARRQFIREQGRRALLFGSSGSSGGSMLQAMEDSAVTNEANQANIRYSTRQQAANARYTGDLQGWEYRTQAANYGAQAKALRKSIPGRMFGTLLGGGADAFAMYGMSGGFGGGGGGKVPSGSQRLYGGRWSTL